MEIILIRHAQSMLNAGLTTNLDSEITELGVEQATRTAKYLSQNFDCKEYEGIVSPFWRTLQTAEIISDITGIIFKVVPSPREFLQADNPHIKKDVSVMIPNRSNEFSCGFNWPSDPWDQHHSVFYDVETIESFMKRMLLFLDTLEEDKKYIIISHSAPIRAIYTLITHYDLKGRVAFGDFDENHSTIPDIKRGTGIKNCSITHIRNYVCKELGQII